MAPLYRIGQLDPIWLTFRSPSLRPIAFRTGDKVSAPLPQSQEVLTGRITGQGATVHAASQTVCLYAQISNPNLRLKPGQPTPRSNWLNMAWLTRFVCQVRSVLTGASVRSSFKRRQGNMNWCRYRCNRQPGRTARSRACHRVRCGDQGHISPPIASERVRRTATMFNRLIEFSCASGR